MHSCAPTGAIGDLGIILNSATVQSPYLVPWAIRATIPKARTMAGEGQQTKMELVYQYLTGPRFRHRIEAVVERFSEMQADLDRERKAMMRLWAKREEQIRGVVESTARLCGDLQGIAGRGFLEIDGLELPLLDAPVACDAAE
jgi:hypothetical protein